MKIERVEVFGVAVPLVGEYKNAYLAKTVQKSAIVRITATGGVVGLGNIDPGPGYSKEGIADHLRVLETVLKPLLLGMDPCNIHEIMARTEPAIDGFLDSKAAIEMACVDLAARAGRAGLHLARRRDDDEAVVQCMDRHSAAGPGSGRNHRLAEARFSFGQDQGRRRHRGRS